METPAAALGRVIGARGFCHVVGCPPLAVARGLWVHREDGHAAHAERISSRHGAATNVRRSIRQKASAPPRRLCLLFSSGSESRLISLDRVGRNQTKSCPALLPFPSSFAIPVRTRASARGMRAVNFAAVAAGQALVLASRWARRELPGPRASQLSRAPRPNPLDVPEAAAS
jgi:hypothetical protein